jgi:hypothetical protein
MAYIQLPVRSDLPAYQFQTELEEETFFFDFEWNERGQYWTMTISNSDEEVIIAGIRLVSGISLLEQFTVAGRPKGRILCVDTTGKNIDPSISDFGSRVLLMYRESTTVD